MATVRIYSAIGNGLLAVLLGTLPAVSGPKEPATLRTMSAEEKIALNSRWDLGYYLFQMQEYAAAAREFEKLRLILPTDASLLALIGSCYSMAGRWQDGETALLQARTQNPDDDDINSLLGQFYLSAGKPMKGAAYMEHSLRTTPEQDELRTRLVSIYLDAGLVERAQVHLELLLKARGGELFGEAELDNDYARCMIQAGKFKEGLAFAEKAHRAEPSNPRFSRVLGLCLLGNNRYREAAEMLSAGKAELQADADLYLQLGEALFMDRRWEEAEKSWLDGVARYPSSYDLLSRLVEYYVGTAKPELARRTLAYGESRNPGNPGNLLLETLLKRKLSSYAAAWKSLGRLKRQSCGPLAVEALWEEAQLDFATGKYGACDRILDNLLTANHRKAEAHMLKAKLALQSGDKAAAQAQILEARKANPYNLKVYALAREAFSGSAELAKLTQP